MAVPYYCSCEEVGQEEYNYKYIGKLYFYCEKVDLKKITNDYQEERRWRVRRGGGGVGGRR